MTVTAAKTVTVTVVPEAEDQARATTHEEGKVMLHIAPSHNPISSPALTVCGRMRKLMADWFVQGRLRRVQTGKRGKQIVFFVPPPDMVISCGSDDPLLTTVLLRR